MKQQRWLGRLTVSFAATLTLAWLGSPSGAHAEGEVGALASRSPLTLGWELEPHLAFGTAPPGFGQGSGLGAGVRGSIVLLPHGILPGVDDSLAVGFGLDYGRYKGDWALSNSWRDQCLSYGTAPDGTRLCTDITVNGGTYTYLFIPLVAQWDFWLTRRFSAFAEGGANLYYLVDHGFSAVPAGYLGGRVRLSRSTALTVRLGYPVADVGISFLL